MPTDNCEYNSSVLMQSSLDDPIPAQRCESLGVLNVTEQQGLDNCPVNANEASESPTNSGQVLENITHQNGNVSGIATSEKAIEQGVNYQDEHYSCATYICDTSNKDEFIMIQISSTHNSEYSFVSIKQGIHPDQRKNEISSKILTS